MRAPPNFQLRDAMLAGKGIVPKAVVSRLPKQWPGVGKFPPFPARTAPETVNTPQGGAQIIPSKCVQPPSFEGPKTSSPAPHTMGSPIELSYLDYKKRKAADAWNDAAKRMKTSGPRVGSSLSPGGPGTGDVMQKQTGWVTSETLLKRGLVPPRSSFTPQRVPPLKQTDKKTDIDMDLGSSYRIIFDIACSPSILRDVKNGRFICVVDIVRLAR